MGVEGNLFEWFCDYLNDRKICVVINGQTSEWLCTDAGVPKGSILGPLLFLIFTNDITANIESDIHLFSDDTSLMQIIDDYLLSYSKLKYIETLDTSHHGQINSSSPLMRPRLSTFRCQGNSNLVQNLS